MDNYGNITESFLDTPVGRLNLREENVNGIFSNATLLSMLLLSLTKNRPFPKTTSKFEDEYDYIIVGGGSAGSVMANRLSEKDCVNVLLLEAGAEAPYLSEVPSMTRLLYESKVDWAYKTEPQKYCAKAHNNRQLIWNSGKALGGSSVINAMQYIRGNKKNYDDWAEEGAKGWSYEEVLPYFKKLEDYKDVNELDKDYYGTGGPMTVEKPKYMPDFKKPAIDALKSFGFEETDSNSRKQTGIYDPYATFRDGFRCSTAKAYLVPAENRPNLQILKSAFVKKILIKDKVAQGVEFDFERKSWTVGVRKDVIISSGCVRTPQILMLSGIGPEEELKKFKIDMVANLPVGKNLQDHYSTYMPYLKGPSAKTLLRELLSPVNINRFLKDRSGPLASPAQISLMSFMDRMNTTMTSTDFPKIHLYFVDYNTLDPKNKWNLKRKEYRKVFGPYEGKPMYACLVSLVQPKSNGSITLKSNNPYDHPVIDPRYYEDEDDLRTIVEGMKMCHAVATSKYLEESVGSKPLETFFSGCEKFKGDHEKMFKCHARSVGLSFWHPVGTARMGAPEDPRSVVDPELRVIGVEKLRVVNAAVMPIIPSGNTNIPTIMVAEKAADLMKKDLQC